MLRKKTGPVKAKGTIKLTGKKRFLPRTVNLTSKQIESLDMIAAEEKKERNEIIRDAIDFYVISYGKAQIDLHQSKLADQLRRVEDGLRALTVKHMRMTGDLLYWVSLPYKDGLPQGRLSKDGASFSWAKLNQEGLSAHWAKAKAFSHFVVNAKSRKLQGTQQESQTAADEEKP